VPLRRALTAAIGAALGLNDVSGDVPGRGCFHSGFFQEAQVAEPVDEAVLPWTGSRHLTLDPGDSLAPARSARQGPSPPVNSFRRFPSSSSPRSRRRVMSRCGRPGRRSSGCRRSSRAVVSVGASSAFFSVLPRRFGECVLRVRPQSRSHFAALSELLPQLSSRNVCSQ
jgi:hypothetical protein